MKKNKILILLVIGLSLGSCVQTDDEAFSPEPTVKGGEKSITAICAVTATTRTSLNASMNVVWTQNDEIRLFGTSTPNGAVYTTAANSVRTAVFDPVDASVDDAIRYAIYPASAASGSRLEGTTLAVDFSALAGQKWMGAFNADSEISSLPMAAASDGEAFSFKNLCGGVRIQLTDYQLMGISIKSVAVRGNDGEQVSGIADVNAADGIVSLRKSSTPSAAATALVTCDTSVPLSADNNPSAHTDFVLFLPAVNYTKGLTFVITDAAGRIYEQATPGAFTIEAGVVKPMELLPVTLYYGKANCYRTASAGTLEIDVTPYYSLAGDYTYENRPRVNVNGELVDKAVSATVLWTQTNSFSSGDVLSAVPAACPVNLTIHFLCQPDRRLPEISCLFLQNFQRSPIYIGVLVLPPAQPFSPAKYSPAKTPPAFHLCPEICCLLTDRSAQPALQFPVPVSDEGFLRAPAAVIP